MSIKLVLEERKEVDELQDEPTFDHPVSTLRHVSWGHIC